MSSPTEHKFGRTAASLEGKQPTRAIVERESRVGLLEKARRTVVDLRHGTEQLRRQILVAENSLAQERPTRPDDVTLENVHLLDSGRLIGQDDWKAAVGRLVELPELPVESSVLPAEKPAWRRARTEYGVATATVRAGNSGMYELGAGQGKNLSALLERMVYPAGELDSDSSRQSQVQALAAQIQNRLELLTPGGQRTGWLPAEMEVIIDGVARAEINLGDLHDPRDLTAQTILERTIATEARDAQVRDAKLKAEADRAAAEKLATEEDAAYRAAVEAAGPMLAPGLQEIVDTERSLEAFDGLSAPRPRADRLADFFTELADGVGDSENILDKNTVIVALNGLGERWAAAKKQYLDLAERELVGTPTQQAAARQEINALFQPLIVDSRRILEPGMQPVLERVMPVINEITGKMGEISPESQALILQNAADEIDYYLSMKRGRSGSLTEERREDFDRLTDEWGHLPEEDLQLIQRALVRRAQFSGRRRR